MPWADGNVAVCRAHNASFHILFARHAVAAPAVQSVPAGYVAPVATRFNPSAAPPPMPGSVDAYAVNLAQAFGPPVAPNAMCAKHPTSRAVALCQSCHIGVCATCDFVFPGGVHLCPPGATHPKPQISAKRQGLINW